MTGRGDAVERPIKKSEYRIVFGTRSARDGWRDLSATARNAMVDAWDFLTRTPQGHSFTCHPLKGALATVNREGATHEQWQYELPGGARIWFYVTADDKSAGQVVLVRVFTAHPNETK